MQIIEQTHPQEVEKIKDYWNALLTAVLQNIMQVKDLMENHQEANDAQFKEIQESLDSAPLYQVK